jgi:ribosomal protein S18 acetylase RimI-like enzyme
MIEYRHFLNIDPPWVKFIWDKQSEIDGQIPSLTPLMCENNIFAKPYFDPQGLIFAFHRSNGVPEAIGFVHASFAPRQDRSDLDLNEGIISQLKVIPGEFAEAAAIGLLSRGCEYLATRGATQIHAGSRFPESPFYLGLYGGSEIPGVLENDVPFVKALLDSGFEQRDRVFMLRRELSGFRPAGGRTQLAIRRKFQINAITDPKATSWWESCTLGMAVRERFSIYNKQDQVVCGDVSFWDMKPMYGEGRHARGMYGLNVTEEHRRAGIATFLVGESLKYLMQGGVEFVEAQTKATELAALGVLKKLDFKAVQSGLLMTKSV